MTLKISSWQTFILQHPMLRRILHRVGLAAALCFAFQRMRFLAALRLWDTCSAKKMKYALPNATKMHRIRSLRSTAAHPTQQWLGQAPSYYPSKFQAYHQGQTSQQSLPKIRPSAASSSLPKRHIKSLSIKIPFNSRWWTWKTSWRGSFPAVGVQPACYQLFEACSCPKLYPSHFHLLVFLFVPSDHFLIT